LKVGGLLDGARTSAASVPDAGSRLLRGSLDRKFASAPDAQSPFHLLAGTGNSIDYELVF